MIRLALQKSGRLGEESLALFQKAGIDIPQSGRKLRVTATNFPLEILFLRSSDIPEIVSDGAADMGICGQNILKESEQENLQEIRPLGFGKCHLMMAVSKKNADIYSSDFLSGKRIATSYPKTVKDFLHIKNISAETICLSGSVEIAPTLGIADAVCDLVSSGETLAVHNLIPVETLLTSEAALFRRKTPLSEKTLEDLLQRLDSVLQAKNLKSVTMNVSKSSVEKISNLLPGLESPTIMPLAKEDWVALHSVVSEDKNFWETMKKLKKAGAKGILISPIDRVLL